MKYYVQHSVNGALQVKEITEHSSLSAAKIAYWGKCRALENDAGYFRAIVTIMNEEFTPISPYTEVIEHVQPEPPTPEPEPEPTQGE